MVRNCGPVLAACGRLREPAPPQAPLQRGEGIHAQALPHAPPGHRSGANRRGTSPRVRVGWPRILKILQKKTKFRETLGGKVSRKSEFYKFT